MLVGYSRKILKLMQTRNPGEIVSFRAVADSENVDIKSVELAAYALEQNGFAQIHYFYPSLSSVQIPYGLALTGKGVYSKAHSASQVTAWFFDNLVAICALIVSVIALFRSF